MTLKVYDDIHYYLVDYSVMEGENISSTSKALFYSQIKEDENGLKDMVKKNINKPYADIKINSTNELNKETYIGLNRYLPDYLS